MSYNAVDKTTGNLIKIAGNVSATGGGGQYWATCNNQAANQIKTVMVSSDQNFVLEKNAIIFVKFDAANTYTATAEAPVKLNVNGTGDKNVYYANTNAPTGTNTTAFGRQNYINQYIYDGTNWVWQGSSSDNDTTNKVVQTVTTGNADYEVLFSNTADNTTRTEGARKNNNLKFNPSTGNLQTTKINGVTVGNSPKFTDTADASQINFNKTGTNLNSTQVENAIKEVNTKVNILQSEKADTDIVASDFSTATSYTAGDYCIYEGKFYKFKASHSGEWAAADVDEIKIAGELASLNDKVQINIHDGGLESVDFGYNFINCTGALFYANSAPLNGSFGCVSTDGTNHYILTGDSSGKLFWNNARIDASLFKDPYSHTGGIYWRDFTSDFANLNNINITGYGAVQQLDSNYPSTNDGWGDLISFINGPNLGIQIYFGWNDGIYYIRHKYNNNWTSWKKISVT